MPDLSDLPERLSPLLSEALDGAHHPDASRSFSEHTNELALNHTQFAACGILTWEITGCEDFLSRPAMLPTSQQRIEEQVTSFGTAIDQSITIIASLWDSITCCRKHTDLPDPGLGTEDMKAKALYDALHFKSDDIHLLRDLWKLVSHCAHLMSVHQMVLTVVDNARFE